MLARVLLETHLLDSRDFSFYPFFFKKKVSTLGVEQKNINPRGLKTAQLIKKRVFLLKNPTSFAPYKGQSYWFSGEKKKKKIKIKNL